MTVAEMHILFKLELDKIDTLAYPNFVQAEIDLILNVSQDLLIVKRYREFELTQKRIDDLRSLVTSTTLSATGSGTQYAATLPPDYWFTLSSTSSGTGTICGVTQPLNLINKQVTYDRLTVALVDPFNKPDNETALVTFSGSQMNVYTNGAAVSGINFTYLRKPLRMSISATGINNPVGFTNQCELPDHMHREVVAEAVRRTLETVSSERYNTNRQESIE